MFKIINLTLLKDFGFNTSERSNTMSVLGNMQNSLQLKS